MSERASNEHLALIEQALGNIENDYRPTCESVNYGSGCPGPTSASIEFWRRAVDAMPSMLAELRDRRAADLSVEDVEALRWLRDWLPPHLDISQDIYSDCEHCDVARRTLSVLDRIINGGGR